MLLSVENDRIRRLFGDKRAVDMLAVAGFDAIDYSLYDMQDWNEIFEEQDSLKYARALREYAKKQGISFCQAHAPWGFEYGMKMNEEEHEFGRIVKSMAFAAELGAPIIVVHGINTPEDVDVCQYNFDYYNAFLPYCQMYNIKIGVENLFEYRSDGVWIGRRFGSPESFNKMIEMLNSPFFVGCVDVGHARLTGNQPEDFLRAVGENVQCLHIHDNEGVIDSHVLPYMGSMNWDNIIEALREIKYQGDFNLEIVGYTEKYEAEMLPAALKFAADTGRYLMKNYFREVLV